MVYSPNHWFQVTAGKLSLPVHSVLCSPPALNANPRSPQLPSHGRSVPEKKVQGIQIRVLCLRPIVLV